MIVRLRKTPEFTVIRGSPYVPGRPAFCSIHKDIIGYRTIDGGPVREWCRGPGNFKTSQQVGDRGYELGYVSGGMFNIGWECHSNRQPIYRETKYCRPAVAAIPAVPNRIVKNASNGWDAGARSVSTLGVDEYMTLKVSTNPVAVMIGLSELGLEFDYGKMGHSIVVRSGAVSEVIDGVDVSVNNNSATHIRVIRYGDRVEYYADGVKVAEAPMDPSRQVYLYAQLYSDTDDVSSLLKGVLARATSHFNMTSSVGLAIGGVISNDRPLAGGISRFEMRSSGVALAGDTALTEGASTLRVISDGRVFALVAVSGQSVLTSLSNAAGYGAFGVDARGIPTTVMNGVSGSMIGVIKSAGVIRAPAASNSPNIISGVGSLHKYRLSAYMARSERLPIKASGIFPPAAVIVGRTGSTGVINGSVITGTGALALKGKGSGLEGGFLGGTIKFRMRPVIGGDIPVVSSNFISSQEMLTATDFLSVDTAVLFSIFDGVSVESGIDVYLIVGLSFDEHAIVGGSLSFSSLLELIIQEQLRVTPTGAVAQDEALQYAVNAVTGALSRYSNFRFTQFATSGGKTFAVTDSGLYELGGRTDDGDTISAIMDLGANDYGSAKGKRLSSVYAGIHTDGGVYFRVAGDSGEDTIYKAVDYGAESRARTAKGLTARHWRIGLEITDASYADLDNIEVEIGVSQRRLLR